MSPRLKDFLSLVGRGPCPECEGPHLRCTPLHSPKWEHSSHALRREGAPPLRPRVTFPSRGKSPKARQGLRPLESPGAWSPPFSRSLTHRAGLPSDTTKDRFATLRWWANRSFFLPELYLGSHLLLSIRGAAVSLWIACRPEFLPFLGGAARRVAGGMIMPPRGVPRGDTPLGDSLVTFSSGRKSPGCRAERLHQEAQELPAPHKFPGCRAERLRVAAGATSPA